MITFSFIVSHIAHKNSLAVGADILPVLVFSVGEGNPLHHLKRQGVKAIEYRLASTVVVRPEKTVVEENTRNLLNLVRQFRFYLRNIQRRYLRRVLLLCHSRRKQQKEQAEQERLSHGYLGYTSPLAAFNVFCSNDTMVMGPTPPGTGVIFEATL